MSEENQDNVQPAQDNVESTATEQQPQRDDKVAYDTYRRVVGKSKKVMAENDELKQRLNLIEQDKMAADGKKDDVIKSLREELGQTRSQLDSQKQNYAWNIFSSNIKAEAAKRGCKDPDKLLKLLDKEDLGSVEVDDNYTVNRDDLSRLMDKAIRENDFLFGKPAVKVNDVTPSNEKPETGKTLESMSVDEKLLALAKLDM